MVRMTAKDNIPFNLTREQAEYMLYLYRGPSSGWKDLGERFMKHYDLHIEGHLGVIAHLLLMNASALLGDWPKYRAIRSNLNSFYEEEYRIQCS